MKVQHEKAEFQPVTLVIETQAELDWLFACLNISTEGADNAWENLPRQYRGGRYLQQGVQMPMFSAIQQIYKEKI